MKAPSRPGHTHERSPLEIVMAPFLRRVKQKSDALKAAFNRKTKVIRVDVRLTKRSVRRMKLIAESNKISFAMLLRETVDSVFCGTFKQEMLRGPKFETELDEMLEEMVYDES